MVPGRIVRVKELPLTANGKVDRKALSRADLPKKQPAGGYVAPSSRTERQVASIWREVLGVGRIGLRENFFDIGGHSLLMADVHRRVEKLLDRSIPLVGMFQHATIESLAAYLNRTADAGISNDQDDDRSAKLIAGKNRLMQRLQQSQDAAQDR
jgi:hypothetical protein